MKSIVKIRLPAFAVLILLTTGCAAAPPLLLYRPSDYQNVEDAVFVKLYWNCLRPDGRTLAIDGYAESPLKSDTKIYHLTLRLLGYDEKGRQVSVAVGYPESPSIGLGEVSPFKVFLPLQGTEVRFDLQYSYQYVEHDGDAERITQRWLRPRAVTLMEFRWIVKGICQPEATK